MVALAGVGQVRRHDAVTVAVGVELAGQLLERLAIASGQQHGSAARREFAGGRPPDASGRPGQQHAQVGEAHAILLSPERSSSRASSPRNISPYSR